MPTDGARAVRGYGIYFKLYQRAWHIYYRRFIVGAALMLAALPVSWTTNPTIGYASALISFLGFLLCCSFLSYKHERRAVEQLAQLIAAYDQDTVLYLAEYSPIELDHRRAHQQSTRIAFIVLLAADAVHTRYQADAHAPQLPQDS